MNPWIGALNLFKNIIYLRPIPLSEIDLILKCNNSKSWIINSFKFEKKKGHFAPFFLSIFLKLLYCNASYHIQ